MIQRGRYRVLFVCLGNICRSPTAEGVLRRLAADAMPPLPLEIDSAGTSNYHIGDPPDPRSQRAARRRGIDIGMLRARQVGADDFHRFDLILAMDQANLRALRALRPPGARAVLRLFLEFAPEARLLEVPDPYEGDEGDFEIVLDLAEAAARGLIATLREGAQHPVQATGKSD